MNAAVDGVQTADPWVKSLECLPHDYPGFDIVQGCNSKKADVLALSYA